jgi:hypothetical protein
MTSNMIHNGIEIFGIEFIIGWVIFGVFMITGSKYRKIFSTDQTNKAMVIAVWTSLIGVCIGWTMFIWGTVFHSEDLKHRLDCLFTGLVGSITIFTFQLFGMVAMETRRYRTEKST